MPRAKEQILGEMHELMAKKMLQLLQSDEPLTAAKMNAITKFLNDNHITASVEEGTPIQERTNQLSMMDVEAVRGKAIGQ